MNQFDPLKEQAAPIAGYYNALMALLAKAEADAGLDFDRRRHCLQIAMAAMYLTFQHGGGFYSVFEAEKVNTELKDTLSTVYRLLGQDRAMIVRLHGIHGDDPECWPDRFD